MCLSAQTLQGNEAAKQVSPVHHSRRLEMQGVRRAQILLKGLDPKLIYAGNGKELKATDHKPNTEFVAPSLRFGGPVGSVQSSPLPPSACQTVPC